MNQKWEKDLVSILLLENKLIMKPIHILLVEDNEGDIFLITEAFENTKLPNILSVVRDGSESLDFLGKNGIYCNVSQPDILLLDINLPKINGHEVLQFIKGNDSLKHIPVIMLTTSSSPHDINLAYKNYANSYVIKPDGDKTFNDIVNNIEHFWISLASLPEKTSIIN